MRLIPAFVLSLSFLSLGACGGGSGDSGESASPGSGTGSEFANPQPATAEQAHRLLLQATFGPTDKAVQQVMAQGTTGWIDSQLNAPSAYDDNSDGHLTYLERSIQIGKMAAPDKWLHSIADYVDMENDIVFSRSSIPVYRSVWFENALNGPDQLRQRVAFALSQIVVVSDASSVLSRNPEALSYYYDLLARNAFGSYRDLLIDISHSPAMSLYLTFHGSKKYDPQKQSQPDENYARELMQLFAIGLYELNMDGTFRTDAKGKRIPTYTQEDVEELSKVFTGWDMQKGNGYGVVKSDYSAFTYPLRFTAVHHDTGPKTLLGTTIPGGQSGAEDIQSAIDILMRHPNMAPFVSKQLIQRLVTSNPSPAYVSRVAHVFRNTNGDLKAVIRSILLDGEARTPSADTSSFGKIKEPLLAYTQLLRAFDVRPEDEPVPGSRFRVGDSGTTGSVTGAYLFQSDFRNDLGQSPTGAPSVFNFYAPDYVPNDPGFQANGVVSPESELISSQIIINMSNRFLYDTRYSEQLYRQHHTKNQTNKFVISFSNEVRLVENALGGDFANINDVAYKETAALDLANHLNRKLANGNVGNAQIQIIREHIMNIKYPEDDLGARNMVEDVVNQVIATSAYMVQR